MGALLAVVGLGAALLAAWRALARHPDPLARAVAAAAVAGFAYWVVHGSFDWFWEFAGLGAPAFALLGLACALAPRAPARRARRRLPTPGTVFCSGSIQSIAGEAQPARGHAPRARSPAAGARWPLAVALGVAALAAVVSFTAPWLSELQVQSAARVWVRSPRGRRTRASTSAARLNPLSDEPYVVAGSIALRLGELARADHEFALALERTPGDAYATLERGAIASAQRPSPRSARAARTGGAPGPTRSAHPRGARGGARAATGWTSGN